MQFQCPYCACRYDGEPTWLGKTARCKECRETFTILAETGSSGAHPSDDGRPMDRRHEGLGGPAAASSGVEMTERAAAAADSRLAGPPVAACGVEVPSYEQRLAIVSSAFEGTIRKRRLPLLYRFAILVATFLLLLLPLVYVGLIAAVAWGVWWHVMNNWGMVTYLPGRATVFLLLLYIAPPVIGAIAIIFLLKPLVARRKVAYSSDSLDLSREPVLASFIEQICKAVRAPKPRRVDIDMQVNASASFRKGWWSVLRGNDLVLTLGLPMVAGLDASQLAGVIAHEFGHFSQGAGMRLTYVIRSILGWFHRVIHERDRWDLALEDWSHDADIRIGWILMVARGSIWTSRKILWGLHWIGLVATSFLLRQMEYDADRYEVELSGSDVFVETCNRLMPLSVACDDAFDRLSSYYHDGKLVDDFTKVVRRRADALPAATRDALARHLEEEKTGLFDSHPSHGDRIAAARALDRPGIFHLKWPATALFRDFSEVARRATRELYRSHEIPDADIDKMLREADEFLAHQETVDAASDAFGRVTQACFHPDLPQELPELAAGGDVELSRQIARVRAARKRLLEQAPGCRKPYRNHERAKELYVSACVRRKLRDAGFTIPADTPSLDAIKGVMARAGNASAAARQAVVARVAEGLRLWQFRQLDRKLENREATWNRIVSMYEVMNVVHSLLPELRETWITIICMRQLVEALDSVAGSDAGTYLIGTIENMRVEIKEEVRRFYKKLESLEYPFEHGEGKISVAAYAFGRLPEDEDSEKWIGAACQGTELLPPLVARLAGQLALWIEEAETAVGLERLPEPDLS